MTMTNNDPPRTEPPTADRDWFGGRRWTGIGAIAVVIVIVVAIIVVLINNRHQDSTSTPPPAGASSPVAVSTPSSALPTTTPTTAPAGTTWSIYATVALPTLPGAGPTHVSGSIATGYAHTPLGALLADANESYRYGLAPDNEWKSAAAAMLAPGAGADAWAKIRAAHPYGPGGGAGADQLAQIAGFQFVSYTPSDAVIQLATRDSSGNLQVGSDHVTWDGTDWRYVLAPDGSQDATVQNIDSLAGFIEWRGV